MTTSVRGWTIEKLQSLCEDLRSECESLDPLEDSRMLRSLARIAQNISPHSQSRVDTELDALIESSHHEMTCAHSRHQSTDKWRHVYTDACILWSLAAIVNAEATDMLDASSSVHCIARLDRAIIIAGPYGEGRLHLILEIISQIQSHTQWTRKRDIALPSSVVSSYAAPLSLRPPPNTFSQSIKRMDLSAPPSLSAFVSTLSKKPFILSGFVRDWPAMQEHPWRSSEYLRQVSGPGRIVPVEVGSDYRAQDWTQTLMDWDDFLDCLGAPHPGEGNADAMKSMIYLAQHNLFTQFPLLRDDIVIPDYAYTALNAPENYSAYHPPANAEQLVVNAWLGPAGTVSPAHTDPFFNLYAQVVGRKTVWLAPPESISSMYPYSEGGCTESETDSTRTDRQPTHVNPAANNVEPSMSNTSRVDVFKPDDVQFPLFTEHVVPQAVCAILEPGDLLFFPPGWWHAMRSEETSFSVSMWF